MRGRRGFACAAALALIPVTPATASTFNVTRTDDPASGTCTPASCSLRQAVVTANGHMGADIVSLPPGTYRLTQGTLPAITDELTLRGAGAASTVITGAVQSGPSVFARAGAISALANLTVLRLSVSGNTATVDDPATQTIAVGSGGILQESGTLTLQDAVVAGNTFASRATDAAGGVMVNTGAVAVVNSTITGNHVTFGGTTMAGGLEINSGATASVIASTISDNTLTPTTGMTVGAGGVLANATPLTVTNSTISANSTSGPATATLRAGGILANASDLTTTNVTIAGNSAAGSGAVAGNLDANASGTHTLQNTIVAGGIAPAGANCSGTFTSGGGNVETTNQCGLDIALGDQPSTNPILGSLQDNGGPTKTQAIPASSPALDAAVASSCPATDQRGVLRPQGGACDSGAFELGPPVNVTAPVLSGTPQVGKTLTCQPGSWRGAATFSFGWLRNGSAIAGASSSTYKLAAGDGHKAIQCLVTATNPIGAALAVSSAHGVTPFPPPVNRRAPSIAGKLRSGKHVQCRTGAWSGSPAFTFAWLRDGTRIKKAAGAKYRIARRDAGHALQCKVTARNAGGSVAAFSAPRVPRHA